MERMSYVSSYYHCVFGTKERRPLISPGLQERLLPYLGGIARENEMRALEIGGIWRTMSICYYRCPQRYQLPKPCN
jgi:hypothetical protein